MQTSIDISKELKVLKALRRISISPDGRQLLELLRLRLDGHKESLLDVDEDYFREVQGRARECQEMIVTIESASATLDEIDKREDMEELTGIPEIPAP